MGVGQRMEADLDWCSETRTKFDENSNLYFLSAQINSVVCYSGLCFFTLS